MCILADVNKIVYPCKMCHVNVNNKYSVAHCGICQSWVHMKRHKLNHIDCKYLQGLSDSWYCLSCRCKIFPFATPTDEDFNSSITSLSLKEPIELMIKKVYFHHYHPLIWLSCIISSNILLEKKKQWHQKCCYLQILWHGINSNIKTQVFRLIPY